MSHVTLEAIHSQIPVSIFWKDLHSNFLGCNSQFANAARLPSPELIYGKSDYDLPWGDSHGDIYRRGDKDVLEGQLMINSFETQKTANGELITILINKTPLMNESGQKIGIIGSYFEISDFKHTPLPTSLSARQKECLIFLCKGMTAKTIANMLSISVRTVEHHIEELKYKLDCHNKSELIIKALNFDFVKLQIL
jgi:DNA-binding CsgD family transcriptional regulator